MKLNNLLFIVLTFLPIPIFAHGEEVLVTFFYDLITVIVLIIFIALIRWESRGKTLLGLVLIVSVVSIFIVTAQWPYTANRRLIEILGSGVPLFSVSSAYFVFRKRFSVKREDNTSKKPSTGADSFLL